MPLCSRTVDFNDVLWNINKLVHEALAVYLGQDATLVVVSVGNNTYYLLSQGYD